MKIVDLFELIVKKFDVDVRYGKVAWPSMSKEDEIFLNQEIELKELLEANK